MQARFGGGTAQTYIWKRYKAVLSYPTVHLSKDYGTAMMTGKRKGDHKHPFVYAVKAGEMFRDGHKFFISANGVWQVKSVPPQYLEEQSQSRNAEE